MGRFHVSTEMRVLAGGTFKLINLIVKERSDNVINSTVSFAEGNVCFFQMICIVGLTSLHSLLLLPAA